MSSMSPGRRVGRAPIVEPAANVERISECPTTSMNWKVASTETSSAATDRMAFMRKLLLAVLFLGLVPLFRPGATAAESMERQREFEELYSRWHRGLDTNMN